MTTPDIDPGVPRALFFDEVIVVVFGLMGLRSHEQTVDLETVLRIVSPFLVAVLVGWLVAVAWRRPASLLTGLIVWPITVALGMWLRHQVFDGGTARTFVVVAAAFIGACMLGWRLLALLWAHRPSVR